jgi:hypothetical protein
VHSSALVFNSSTLIQSNTTKSSTVWNKTIVGRVATESFQLGDFPFTTQSFLIAEEEIAKGVDGVLGLGFSGLADGYVNLLRALDDSMKDAVFSIFIDKEHNASALTVGGVDEKYGQGDETKMQVAGFDGFWSVKIDEIFVGSLRMNVRKNAYFDLLSNSIQLPEMRFRELVKEIHNKTGGECEEKNWCNCLEEKNIRLNLTFAINGVNYSIPAIQDKECSIIETNKNDIVLGLPFFKEYYLAFDMEKYLITAQKAIDSKTASKFSTLYLVGIIVLCVIIAIPICFYLILSKIRGVAEEPDNEKSDPLTHPLV